MRSAIVRRVGPTTLCLATSSSLTQRRHQAATASATGGQANFGNVPKELRFYVDFEASEQDLHFELLEEANLKHGVYLNVPPQLPPEGSPPEVPDVIICEATLARLRSVTLAYEPTHAPPPFETAGTRGIDDIVTQQPKTTATISRAPAITSPPVHETTSSTAVERKPVDADARFHCSVCHKAFKVRIAGEHHVANSHEATLQATLVDGPGLGEIVLSTKPIVDEKPTSRLTAPVSAAPPKKADYTATELTLPLENDIEDLLKDIWDTVGARLGIKDLKESSAIVAGVADKRPPPGSEDLKPSHSATPAGVAPGIKKSVGKKSLPLNASGKVMTNKEMTARFENPFGDSDVLADFDEDDNKNPFLPVEAVGTSSKVATPGTGKDIDGGVKTSSIKSSTVPLRGPTPKNSFDLTNSNNSQLLAKKLTCHICEQRFRLLDGLHNHYEEEHHMTMPDEVLRASLAINPTASLYEDKVPAARKEAMSASLGSKEKNEGGSDGGDCGEGLSGGSSGADASLVPIPIDEADISIHMRAHSNTILIGDVMEIRRGFIKTHSVLQIILKVTNEKTSQSALEAADGTASYKTDSELITVRCYGDNFNAGPLMNELRVGTQLSVNGVLKLNRRLDKVSNRVHSFPYILVSTPLGSIQMIE